MKRNDIVLTDELKSFLSFDLGHLNEDRFTRKGCDIQYSHNPDLKLDVYYPEEEKDRYPVFLIVFGGGWVSGFKRTRFVEWMLKPLEYGYACVVADYTLALDGLFPQPVIDLKNAVGWIKEHAAEYHFDIEDITLWGESAGGHLGLECALLPDALFQLDTAESSRVKNLVIFYPATDVLSIDHQGDPSQSVTGTLLRPQSIFGLLMGDQLKSEAALKLASPVFHVNPDMPRLWLQHGSADDLVPPAQSEELAEVVRRKCPQLPFFFETAEGKGHTDPWFFSDENVARIMEFIRR